MASQAPHPTNHTGSEFQQLFLGLLDPLWVSFNSDQVALFIVRGNAHRHLVEVLNPVNCKARAVVTHSARPRLGSKDTLTRGCLRSTSASEERVKLNQGKVPLHPGVQQEQIRATQESVQLNTMAARANSSLARVRHLFLPQTAPYLN